MNSPYLYHPQPSSKMAADVVLTQISSHPTWSKLFAQGKMLGVLIVAPQNNSSLHLLNNTCAYLCAYSGVINGPEDPDHFFVPPIYDLQNPDDFYLQKDAEITAINHEIKTLENQAGDTQQGASTTSLIKDQIEALKQQRKALSISLQQEIFDHFSFCNPQGKYKNIIQIFSEAKRGLPPGGSGECAAPRLLQYAYQHGLRPLELAEFWYGASPKSVLRIHGQFYPSCIEKCSPILKYMTDGIEAGQAPAAEPPLPIDKLTILYEDEYLLAVEKSAGALSVPGKVNGDDIETKLHELYPDIKGPMLVHRLDQATSGILLAAKNAQIHKILQQSFETREVHKEYLAVLSHQEKSRCGVIDLPICPNPDDRPRQIVDFLFGKKAVTGYVSLIEKAISLVRFTPLTGRTHQLRLHAASPFGLGNAILGDTIYGGTPYRRLMLHAYLLHFTHPVTGEKICLRSIPSDWHLSQDFGHTPTK